MSVRRMALGLLLGLAGGWLAGLLRVSTPVVPGEPR
ncbi:MAG: hypothetical protein JWN17_1050 [Frankiales bacterium]|nr:hypothetical protein [Frankiales bacterium]